MKVSLLILIAVWALIDKVHHVSGASLVSKIRRNHISNVSSSISNNLSATNRLRRSYNGWTDWIGGLMGGSSPLAFTGGGFGPGWDELFGHALLQIAGYGQTPVQHYQSEEHLLGTHTVVTKKVAYPVPQPYPVTVEKPVPYLVPIPVDRPYPVHVPVYRHIKVPVPSPYPVPVPKPYAVPVLNKHHEHSYEHGYIFKRSA